MLRERETGAVAVIGRPECAQYLRNDEGFTMYTIHEGDVPVPEGYAALRVSLTGASGTAYAYTVAIPLCDVLTASPADHAELTSRVGRLIGTAVQAREAAVSQ